MKAYFALTLADVRRQIVELQLLETALVNVSDPSWPPEVMRYGKPMIVCLCGSTRFWKTFQELSLKLTKQGIIVLSIGCATASDDQLGITAKKKSVFNELHKRKIELADEVLVLNVGGYIGNHTRSEISYAKSLRKQIKYLEALPDGKE